VSFSPSDSVLLPPIDDTFGMPFHPINATYTRESFIMDKIYTNPKAFGYIFPAPTWSIILHMERHGALYSMPIPKFTISYPTSFHDPVVMSVTSDYMVCAEYLDVNSHIILHCRSSDTLQVSSFFEFVVSIISNVAHNNNMKRMIVLFVDAGLRAIALSIDLSDRPIFLVRTLCLVLQRNMWLKHDFYALFVRIKSVKVGFTISFVTVIYSGVYSEVIHLYALIKCKWLLDNIYFFSTSKYTCQGPASLYQKIFKFSSDPQSLDKSTKKEIKLQSEVGGGRTHLPFTGGELSNLKVVDLRQASLDLNNKYKFISYMTEAHAKARSSHGKYIIGDCNLIYLIPRLTFSQLRTVAQAHNIFIGTRWSIENARNAMSSHACQQCAKYLSLFQVQSAPKRDNTAKSKHYRESLNDIEIAKMKAKDTTN